MRSYLLLEFIAELLKYACYYDTEMPLRLRLGSEILIVYLLINSIMNLKKHSIVKVVPTVVTLLVQLVALGKSEMNSLSACFAENPAPNSFSYEHVEHNKISVDTRRASIP